MIRIRLLFLTLMLLGLIMVVPGTAQVSKKDKSKTSKTAGAGSVRALDVRASEMQERLLREAMEISKGYEDAGEYDRAKWLLEVLEKLDPKLPGLKSKIEQLTDRSLDASEFEYEMDVSKDWTPAIGFVQKDRVVRIEVEGDYKLSVNLTATADGLPASDSGNELVAGVPMGALMGVLVNAENKKPGKPFEIKSKREWTPRDTGILQLKINVPPGHKCSGKLTVKLGGVSKLPT